MIGAPQVYIGTQLMDSYALEDMPMLAGLSFNWGTDDLIEFADPGTCSASLLIREPGSLDFLAVGEQFAIIDPGTGATFFAGRIATLKAKHRKKSLRIDLTAVEALASLQQYRLEKVEWNIGDTTKLADTRRAQLTAAIGPGWQLQAGAGSTWMDWTTVRPQRWIGKPYLELLDMHLRSTINRRHDTSFYTPGTGLRPQLTITRERAKDAPAETLRTRIGGQWYASATAPNNTAFLQLTAGNIARESLEWEKTPDDTITDVKVTSWGQRFGTPETEAEESASFDLWVQYSLDVNNGPIQAKYGFHQVAFDIDSIGGAHLVNPHIGRLVNYWVDADTEWRPTTVEIPDSRRLPDADVLKLLHVDQRYLAYVTLGGLPSSSPVPGSRARAYIIAGAATWTGKKWVITIALGRVPRAPATGGYHTFDTIETHTDPAISTATAETVGDELTFADFAYIGA